MEKKDFGKYNNLYLKLKYYQSIFSKLSIEDLKKYEEDIYNDKDELEKVTYELQIIKSYMNNLSNISNEEYIIYSKIMNSIDMYTKIENMNLIKAKELIALCEIFLNLDLGFYSCIPNIEFDIVVKDIEKNYVLTKDINDR